MAHIYVCVWYYYRNLRVLDTLGRFSAIFFFTREITFVTSCLHNCTPSPFRKGSVLKGKNFLSSRANSLLLEDLFFRVEFDRVISSESVSISLNHISWALTFVLLNPDIPCLCKQYRSRSVGFWRSQLIWICTVCHWVCEFEEQSRSSNLID